MTGHTWA